MKKSLLLLIITLSGCSSLRHNNDQGLNFEIIETSGVVIENYGDPIEEPKYQIKVPIDYLESSTVVSVPSINTFRYKSNQLVIVYKSGEKESELISINQGAEDFYESLRKLEGLNDLENYLRTANTKIKENRTSAIIVQEDVSYLLLNVRDANLDEWIGIYAGD